MSYILVVWEQPIPRAMEEVAPLLRILRDDKAMVSSTRVDRWRITDATCSIASPAMSRRSCPNAQSCGWPPLPLLRRIDLTRLCIAN